MRKTKAHECVMEKRVGKGSMHVVLWLERKAELEVEEEMEVGKEEGEEKEGQKKEDW